MQQPDDEAADYSPGRFRTPDGAPADIVIFTITATPRKTIKKSLPHRKLEVLLIQRKVWPFKGQWALPGGFSRETETLLDTARRELETETGVKDVHVEYFNAYSEPGRDPRGWIISHAFFALVHESLLAERKADDDAADVRLFPVEEALEMELAFDHRTILSDALAQIRRKMLTTVIAKQFLPAEFTLGELHHVIKAVVPEFEEQNFIRKVTSTQSRKGLIEEALDSRGECKMSNQYSQRAAKLYRFTTEELPPLSIYG